MNPASLHKLLAGLPLDGLRYFDSLGSTNDEALAWAADGARDLSLVIADEQTSGRGRAGRKWSAPPATALTFSLILRPVPAPPEEAEFNPSLFTGLGAAALADALKPRGLEPRIKWPNDVLLDGKKVAGILAEAVWTGDALDAAVIGIGVNARAGSNPPDETLRFPATNLEAELGRPVERGELLRDILSALIGWRAKMRGGELIKAWEENLAFRGQEVRVWQGSEQPLAGRVAGLASDGSLLLLVNDKIVTVQFGETRLRPAL